MNVGLARFKAQSLLGVNQHFDSKHKDKVALLYNLVLEWVTNSEVKRRIVPVEGLNPAVALSTTRVM